MIEECAKRLLNQDALLKIVVSRTLVDYRVDFMNETQLQEKFSSIRVWKRDSTYALNKPLLILYTLGKYYRRGPRLIPFSEVDKELQRLLQVFGPTRTSLHPEYAFWRLRNDRIWELVNVENVSARQSNSDAKKSELLKYNAKGGLTEEIYEYLRANPTVVPKLAKRIIDTYLPHSEYEPVLNAVGIPSC